MSRLTYILLHAQEGFPWLVLSVAHVAKLLQVLIRGLLGVLAPVTRAGPLFAATLEFEIVIYRAPASAIAMD
jgi:hypothetical protein